MWRYLLFVLGICILLPEFSCGDFVFSMAQTQDEIEAAIEMTTKILPSIENLLTIQDERLQKIENLVIQLNELSGDEIRDPNFTVLHPLNAYRFMRNHSIISNGMAETLIQEIHTFEKEKAELDLLLTELPGHEKNELHQALQGILRLQTTYDLDIVDMAVGNFAGVQSGLNVSAEESATMAAVAYRSSMTTQGSEWLTKTTNLITKGDNSISMIRALSTAATAAYKGGGVREAASICSNVMRLAPKSRYHRLRLKHYMRSVRAANNKKNIKNSKATPSTFKSIQLEQHNSLCQGHTNTEILTRQAPSRELICKLTQNHPMLLLDPAKMEERSLEPYIVVYYDVISKAEMTKLKLNSKLELERSRVKNRDGSRRIVDNRTSKGMFMNDKLTANVRRKVGAITHMDMNACEKIQVANYGLGGHYYLHHDFIFDDNNNRLATFMIYLSNVDRGGATIFPGAGEAIFPEEGKAVFWYNLHRNGTRNRDTQHAACPVIVGDKWVANFWIHEHGQEFRQPCGLNQFSMWS